MPTNREISAVSVYCGSSTGKSPAFAEAAVQLGLLLAERGVQLIYGGASVGLMGVLADTVVGLGGKITGVIPSYLVEYEVAHEGLSDLIVVESMHERKAAMAERSDAFIALPGGFGTLDETFEMITWTQIGLQHKPVGFLDVDDFFAPLRQFIDRLVDEGFVAAGHRDELVFESDPARLLDGLATVELLPLRKWLEER